MYFDEPECEYSPFSVEEPTRYVPEEDFEFRHLVDSSKWIEHADSLGMRKSRTGHEVSFEPMYDDEIRGGEAKRANCSKAPWQPTPIRKRPLAPQSRDHRVGGCPDVPGDGSSSQPSPSHE